MGVRKIPTFFRWLTFQQERKDSVGHLAKVVVKTKKEKPISSNYMEWYFFIEREGKHQLLEDLNDAWEEYNSEIN